MNSDPGNPPTGSAESRPGTVAPVVPPAAGPGAAPPGPASRVGRVLGPFGLWAAVAALCFAFTGPTWISLFELAIAAVGGVSAWAIYRRRPRWMVGPATGAPSVRPGVLLAQLVGGDLLFGLLLLSLGLGAHLGRTVPTPVAVLLAPAFLVLLGAEVAVLALRSLGPIDYRLVVLLVAQGAIVALTPAMFLVGPRAEFAAVAGSSLVIGVFVVALQYLYRTKQLSSATSRYLVGWALAAVATGAGWFLWAFDHSPYVLAASVLVQAAVALSALELAPPVNVGERSSWLVKPFWTFLFLLFTFLAEFFLGALLDLEIAGRGFVRYIPFVHPSGSASAVADAQLYNGLWFAAAIMASAWFLVAIGFTMGPLVLLKIRETRERPQRYRLALTIAVYALAAVYIPSFASSTPLMNVPALANLPVLGWGFGLRAGGPFEAGISVAVLLMYLGVGVLTVLFGRKALCSVMCGAALLYQGTTIHEMRSFNQSSRVGRYFLGSQLSTVYVVFSGVAVATLCTVSILSFLKLLPAVQVASGQLDTAALPLPIELYFGGVWFAMFVSTPYVGTYNCATTGFCHWGAFSLPFAKVGFFRLKVKDRKVCEACTTFDCAKACPVGLVDMPLHFRTSGEYRSSKCCGVGDCVGACPYGNMYHQDVRFWLRRRLGRAPADNARAPVGTPLPMVGGARAPVPPVAVLKQ